MAGIGAAVLGLLLAAWYQPVFTKGSYQSNRHGVGAGGLGFVGTTQAASWVPVFLLGALGAVHCLWLAADTNLHAEPLGISGTGLRLAPELFVAFVQAWLNWLWRWSPDSSLWLSTMVNR